MSAVVSLVPPAVAPAAPAVAPPSAPVEPGTPPGDPGAGGRESSDPGPAGTRPRPAPNRRAATGKGRRSATPAARPAPAGGSSRTRGALEGLFADLGLDVTVTEVATNDSGPTALLTLGPDLFPADLEPYADDLVTTLRVKSVWFVALDEETVRVETLRRPAKPAGSRRQCTVLIPDVVKEALKAAAEPTGKTENSFVLDAFDRQFARLDTFFPTGKPFSGRCRPRTARFAAG